MKNKKLINATLSQIQEIKSDEISIEIYCSIENKNLLTELDEKIIEFCKRHLEVH